MADTFVYPCAGCIDSEHEYDLLVHCYMPCGGCCINTNCPHPPGDTQECFSCPDKGHKFIDECKDQGKED